MKSTPPNHRLGPCERQNTQNSKQTKPPERLEVEVIHSFKPALSWKLLVSIMTQSLPFYLTPEDLEVLSMTDEEYTLLSWEFIKGVIGISA